jgi:hypothetical protein
MRPTRKSSRDVLKMVRTCAVAGVAGRKTPRWTRCVMMGSTTASELLAASVEAGLASRVVRVIEAPCMRRELMSQDEFPAPRSFLILLNGGGRTPACLGM